MAVNSLSLGPVSLDLEKGLLLELVRFSGHLGVGRFLLIVVTHHKPRLFLNYLLLLLWRFEERARHVRRSLFAFSQANLVVR